MRKAIKLLILETSKYRTLDDYHAEDINEVQYIFRKQYNLIFSFLLTANMCLALLIYLYSIHRVICRPSDCGEAPGRDSNPGRAEQVAGTLTIKPPHQQYCCCFYNNIVSGNKSDVVSLTAFLLFL